MITVRFDKNGFYHPAFGRMGLGKHAGDIYTLPDHFSAEGTLPKSATIITDLKSEAFEELLEDQDQTKPHKMKVLDEAQMEIAQKRVADAKATQAAAAAEKTAAEKKPAAKKK